MALHRCAQHAGTLLAHPFRLAAALAATLQEASAAADAARQEAGAARAALSASQSHAQALQARLSAKAAELSGLSGREEALKERVNDLQAFVDVSLRQVLHDAMVVC